MDDKDQIVLFFGEIQRVIKKYGYDHVMKKLRELHDEESDGFQKEISNFILYKTCNHYLVSRDDVLFSKKRGVISEARRMCYALMKEHLRLSDEKIGFFFGGRSRQYVNRELNELPLNKDDYTTKEEAKFVEDFLVLTKEVLFYKNASKETRDSEQNNNVKYE